MIQLERVTKAYGGLVAVDDLSLDVERGEVVVLLGPSGCGKTTTLRAINRLIDIDSGTIRLDGVDVRSRRPDELRRQIGYVIQSIGLFPHMTVARNVGAVPRLLGWDRQRIERRTTEMLEMVGLDPAEYAEKHPGQLSGGQQQRVGVARALAADPPVLLMDEPFGALDPLSRERLQSVFIELQRQLGKTVVFVTHDVEEAVVLADRIALMESGRLVQCDVPERLLESPASAFAADFFGGDLPLEMLARLSVANARLERDEGAGLRTVALTASLKQTVAEMISAGTERLAVVAADGSHHGVLTFRAVVEAVKTAR